MIKPKCSNFILRTFYNDNAAIVQRHQTVPTIPLTLLSASCTRSKYSVVNSIFQINNNKDDKLTQVLAFKSTDPVRDKTEH